MKIISDSAAIDLAASALCDGQLVIFPTETVYGIGANAFCAEAVRKIFRAKGRPGDNPLICHLASTDQLSSVAVDIPEVAKRLFDFYAPGPITLILPKHPDIPEVVSAGLDTVGVRIPSHPLAFEFLRRAGVPVAAPSANISGKPSATVADYADSDFSKCADIAYLIDGGESEIGIESTVIDVTREIPVILRPGKITAEQIAKDLGIEVIYASDLGPNQNSGADSKSVTESTPRAPGMKYRHYAPEAKMVLISGEADDAIESSLAILREVISDRAVDSSVEVSSADAQIVKHLGLWVPESLAITIENAILKSHPHLRLEVASYRDVADAMKNLFRQLREFDRQGCDLIIAYAECESEHSRAYLNRLRKAASTN